MKCITYRSGYDYQLKEDYHDDIGIEPPSDIESNDKITVAGKKIPFIKLHANGSLIIKSGYAWDGATGAPDVPSNMRATLVHDALYQLMRNKKLDRDKYKEAADRLLQKHCKEDGMLSGGAWIMYQGVHWWGDPATRGQRSNEHAPKRCRKKPAPAPAPGRK